MNEDPECLPPQQFEPVPTAPFSMTQHPNKLGWVPASSVEGRDGNLTVRTLHRFEGSCPLGRIFSSFMFLRGNK